jgi:hypothetical protein
MVKLDTFEDGSTRLVIAEGVRTLHLSEVSPRGATQQVQDRQWPEPPTVAIGVPDRPGVRSWLHEHLVMLIVLALGAGLGILSYGPAVEVWQEHADERSRREVMTLWREARALLEEGDRAQAREAFVRVVVRGQEHLERVGSQDALVQEILRVARTLVTTLAPTGERGKQLTLEDLLAADRLRVFLDLRRVLPRAGTRVAGLGVSPGVTPVAFQEIWGEPGRSATLESKGEEAVELWSYREEHGFAVVVRLSPDDEGEVEEMILYPSFAGVVDGRRLAGTTTVSWEVQYGRPAAGSTSTSWHYTRPFAGLVTFDAERRLQEVQVDFRAATN